MSRLQKLIIVGFVLLNIILFTAYSIVVIANRPVLVENIIKKEIKFKIDNSFTLKEKKEIKDVINEWNKIARGCYIIDSYEEKVLLSDVFSWMEDRKPTIYNAQSLLNWKYYIGKYNCLNPSSCIGIAFPEIGDIFIFSNRSDLFKSIMRHEIGHILKLGHNGDINNLMYPILSFPKSIGKKESMIVSQCFREQVRFNLTSKGETK